jgi:glycosyltransferase involved in cell wall biosynthesis
MKLSIITICKNDPEGLKNTIKSVIKQNWNDYEHIIIDGTDDDSTVQILEEYKNSLITRESDTGIYNAMNKGTLKASGKFLLYLNSGDELYETNTLERVFEILSNDIDIAFGDIELIKNNNIDQVKLPDQLDSTFFIRKSLPHPSTFIKRDLILNLGGYDEKYRIVADYAFFVKAFLLNNIKYKHIPIVVSKFKMDGVSSKAENLPKIKKERDMAFFGQLPELYSETIINYQSTELLRKSRWIKFAEKVRAKAMMLKGN